MSRVLPFADEGWPVLRALLRRPWFRRLWVIQEFVLGKKVWFMCGSEWKCSWTKLWDPLESLMHYNVPALLGESTDDLKTSRETLRGWDCFRRIVIIKRAFDRGRPLTLDRLMLTSRRAKASDPRDDLFRMLGLAHNVQHDEAFYPDYNEELISVVTRYAARFVQLGSIDYLLRDAGAGPHCAEFPSWIPDWAYANPRKPIPINWTLAFESGRNLFCAGGTSTSRAGFATEEYSKENVFVLGSPVDTIAKLGSPYHEHPLHAADVSGYKSMNTCLQSAIDIMDMVSSYPTAEDPKEVMWRTLIANKTKDNHEVSKNEMEESFHAFEEWLAREIARDIKPGQEDEPPERDQLYEDQSYTWPSLA